MSSLEERLEKKRKQVRTHFAVLVTCSAVLIGVAAYTHLTFQPPPYAPWFPDYSRTIRLTVEGGVIATVAIGLLPLACSLWVLYLGSRLTEAAQSNNTMYAPDLAAQLQAKIDALGHTRVADYLTLEERYVLSVLNEQFAPRARVWVSPRTGLPLAYEVVPDGKVEIWKVRNEQRRTAGIAMLGFLVFAGLSACPVLVQRDMQIHSPGCWFGATSFILRIFFTALCVALLANVAAKAKQIKKLRAPKVRVLGCKGERHQAPQATQSEAAIDDYDELDGCKEDENEDAGMTIQVPDKEHAPSKK